MLHCSLHIFLVSSKLLFFLVWFLVCPSASPVGVRALACWVCTVLRWKIKEKPVGPGRATSHVRSPTTIEPHTRSIFHTRIVLCDVLCGSFWGERHYTIPFPHQFVQRVPHISKGCCKKNLQILPSCLVTSATATTVLMIVLTSITSAATGTLRGA